MRVEETFSANIKEPKNIRIALKPGLYICYNCNKGQTVYNDGILRFCPKCGSSQFYQQ